MEHLGDLKAQAARLPRSPGVYQWIDGAGTILYVGKATDLRARTRSYVQDPSVKGGRLMEESRRLDYIAVSNEKEALVLEQTLIKRHKPRYNVRLTDDKQYPYIWLTPGPYPRLVKTHGQRGTKGTWFGPFPDGYGAFHVMQTLNELLPLRRCKTLPKQKCLYYDIGKCIAPCIHACTDEEYDALVQQAKDVLGGRSRSIQDALSERLAAAAARHDFEEAARLRDQLRGLQGVLEKQNMVKADLEDRDICAIALQDDVGVVAIMHQRGGKVVGQSPFVVRGTRSESAPLSAFLRGYYVDRQAPRFVAMDLAADRADEASRLEHDLRELSGRAVTVEAPQKGDKRRWIEVAKKNAQLRLVEETERAKKRGEGALGVLQGHLGLPSPPRVIEGFDISHLAGEHMRAAMVRFVDGEPDKAGYRTFGMQTVGAAAVASGAIASKGRGRDVDDFAAIGEAVLRRYKRLLEEGGHVPDLIVIDGGLGQLSAARASLAQVGAEIAICSLAKKEELVHVPGRVHPIKLARNDAGLQLLQRVRDESHRFGIKQVRSKATAKVSSGPLEGIAGIGPARRAKLVQAFGGLEGLRVATVEDLTAMPGITLKMAKDIVETLQAE